MEQETQKQQKQQIRPITVRIEDFKTGLQKVVTESELPPFILEMILGEYLAGVSIVARGEYAQDREQWEKYCKENEQSGEE